MNVQVTLPQQEYDTLRRWPRHNIDLPICVIAEKSNKIIFVQGRGRELNNGGMALFAGVELDLQEQIAVEFTPPYAGEPIRVMGIVRNRQAYTYGVEFIPDSRADRKKMCQLAGC